MNNGIPKFMFNRVLFFIALLIFSHFSKINAQNTTLPPAVLNDPMYPLGYLNVTALGIDNTGSIDVTTAINNAIVMARDNKLVCYFPGGTYLISNTIKGMLLSYDHDNNPATNYFSDRREPVVMVGECDNRPVLKLQAGASGFQNPGESTSKAAVIIWASPNQGTAMGSQDPDDELPGIAFNQIFRNFIIDLNGNPGAVGIRFAGAQGASMENIQIIATNAYAGLQRMLGQASGYYNVEVIGGQYGILVEDSYRALSEYAFLSGVKFINQTNAVFGGFVYCPITIVGFYIENSHGKVFKNHPATRGGLSMIDGVINVTGNPTQASFTFYSNRSLFLKNVDIRGNQSVLGTPNPIVVVNPNVWTKFVELSYCPDGQTNIKNIDKCTSNDDDFIVKKQVNQPSDIDEIFEKHIGPISDCIDINNAINVKDASQMTGPNGTAKGDGFTDDTAALQWALDNYSNVFLPKGTYIISNTLLLKYNTNLFGVGKVFSIIKAAPSWNTNDAPILKTINNVNANTKLNNIMIEIDPFENYNLTALHWQAGRNSVVQNIMFGVDGFLSANISNNLHYGYKINGSGGGRWYNTCAEWHKLRYTTTHQNYRGLLVDGTNEPLTFYSLNVERVRTEPQVEIKNASHVNIYYFKSEAGGSGGLGTDQEEAIPLKIMDGNHINLYGGTGKIELDAGEGMVEIYDCKNSTITHLKSFKNIVGTYTIKTECNDLANTVNLAIYRSCKSIKYVNQFATGSNTGENWEDAFVSLQSALTTNSNACGKDEIWVAKGSYYPTVTTDRTRSFILPDGYEIYGGFEGCESDFFDKDHTTNSTILSGEIGSFTNTDNIYHVVKATNVQTDVLLDGFTIEKGYGNGIGTDNRGGGLFIANTNTGTINLSNNIIQNNFALLGGGIYNAAKTNLSQNIIRYNEASINGSSIYTWGTNAILTLQSGNNIYDQICNTCYSLFYYENGGEVIIHPSNYIEN